jgi:zinc transporter 5/7
VHRYRRAEVLAGFVNGIFLVFVAFFVFTESIERLMEPPEVSTDRLMFVSVLGFCVNLVGIFVFNHGYADGDSS